MSRTRREKERAQKLWAERRELIRFSYGKLAEAIVRQARAHYQRALQAWQQGNLSEAETALRQALELNPDAPDPLIALGRLLVKMGRTEEAIGVLSKACELDAENPEAHFLFGQALEAAQRWRRARDAYGDRFHGTAIALHFYRGSLRSFSASPCFLLASRVV